MKINPEYAKRMREIKEKYYDNHDLEEAHIEADELMEEILIACGYKEVVDIFEEMDLWYS